MLLVTKEPRFQLHLNIWGQVKIKFSGHLALAFSPGKGVNPNGGKGIKKATETVA